jgi:hypothetical protein
MLVSRQLIVLLCSTSAGGAAVEALRYKPEGHGIDFRDLQNFSLT